MAMHWKVALIKLELAITLIPDGTVMSPMKLNPEGGGGDVLPDTNIIVEPEGGLITHFCTAGIT